MSPWWWLLEILFVPLVLLGIYDYFQPRHSILRNYPLAGRMRFLLEGMGPELHQYLVENDTDGRPFDRDTRSVIYERAKNVGDKKPFGTEHDVYDAGYSWLNHSIAPRPMAADPEADLRVIVGGEQCSQPYSASVLNISAMSFGALGQAAVRAMNQGALAGGFAHDTGEGGLSKYHKEAGGDLIWQIGTGYFGCRDANGDFDPEAFRATSTLPQVKMIEIKVSQGAKPGHGGILPAAKVTAEIAEARLVPQGKDVFSPTYHKAFSTPLEMVGLHRPAPRAQRRQAGRLQDLHRRPAGVHGDHQGDDPDRHLRRLHRRRRRRGRHGRGAAGVLRLPRSAPERGPCSSSRTPSSAPASGTASRSAPAARWSRPPRWRASMALGADWCNSARAFMFAVGCIQSQRCHTNKCPVGVTTQDAKLQRALIVPDKAERVHNYHRNTVHALAEMIAAMGLDHTSELSPYHAVRRVSQFQALALEEIYDFVQAGSVPRRHRERALPRLLGPGVRRVLPTLVCRGAGITRLSGAGLDRWVEKHVDDAADRTALPGVPMR